MAEALGLDGWLLTTAHAVRTVTGAYSDDVDLAGEWSNPIVAVGSAVVLPGIPPTDARFVDAVADLLPRRGKVAVDRLGRSGYERLGMIRPDLEIEHAAVLMAASKTPTAALTGCDSTSLCCRPRLARDVARRVRPTRPRPVISRRAVVPTPEPFRGACMTVTDGQRSGASSVAVARGRFAVDSGGASTVAGDREVIYLAPGFQLVRGDRGLAAGVPPRRVRG
jgi:hypothetical protein